ncbi:maleylpyruvate isomerase N-terminal domain-containing protein [Mycolicibacterium komossense]|uniref:Maleylpyruvate isomerase N-terminal domain-containing protein n=1 Tax=Mycolicibacterium komossense TaxID=1779 RepID=A0ABT3CK29_9MYCO|nr:maleylpyruvate isomerase N-terminal domain-containing protein [Mycolicibacterium komossense]MCV7229817.1 maleylpyruvate isomerase N-terminal domain-containing protein [Mycolicibacterium komossense]
MTEAGVASARLSAAQLDELIPHIHDSQWDSPSACAGWRVIDVLAHLGALAHEAVDPPPPEPGLPTVRERYHDLRVDQRRSLSHAEVIDEWRTYTPRQLDLLEADQASTRSAGPVTVPGLGVYPRHLLANTMAFNVLCHLRYDMLAPDGPLPFTLPPPTDQQVSPAIGFMLAGLPQMQGPELDNTVTVPLSLELTGPGATTVTVHPARGSGTRLTLSPGDDGSTRIRSTALSFIAWGTTRKPWRPYCTISGDEPVAAAFLDCLNII